MHPLERRRPAEAVEFADPVAAFYIVVRHTHGVHVPGTVDHFSELQSVPAALVSYQVSSGLERGTDRFVKPEFVPGRHTKRVPLQLAAESQHDSPGVPQPEVRIPVRRQYNEADPFGPIARKGRRRRARAFGESLLLYFSRFAGRRHDTRQPEQNQETHTRPRFQLLRLSTSSNSSVADLISRSQADVIINVP